MIHVKATYKYKLRSFFGGKSFSFFFFVADFLIGEEYKRTLVFHKSGVCVSILVERLARQTKPIARDSSTKFFSDICSFPFLPIEKLYVYTILLFRLLCSFRFMCLSIERNCSANLFGQRQTAKPERIVAMRPKRNMINDTHTIRRIIFKNKILYINIYTVRPEPTKSPLPRAQECIAFNYEPQMASAVEWRSHYSAHIFILDTIRYEIVYVSLVFAFRTRSHKSSFVCF